MPALHQLPPGELEKIAERISRDQNPWLWRKIDALTAQLEASQAREAELREAMLRATLGSCSCVTKTPDYRHHADFCGYRTLSEALALPTDDTALKARLKAERERCATLCSVLSCTASGCADAIRNLGD